MRPRPTIAPSREAVEARPWRPADGPRPTVHVYPPAGRPALWVYASGAWRLGWVTARHDYADGTVVYQVEIALPREDGPYASERLYRWPQAGLAVADPGTPPSGQ